jgi:hypothetical protein
MKNGFHPLAGGLERLGLGQITQDVLHRQPFEQRQVAGGAVEGTHVVTALDQCTAELRPNKTGGSCDKNVHCISTDKRK